MAAARPASGDRREAIIERLADHVLAHGLAGASLRPLARAAGTSDRMLLYYFRDKAELIAAVLTRIAERVGAVLAAEASAAPLPPAAAAAELVALVTGPRLWPYMAVWLEVATMAARGDPVAGAIGEAIGRGFLAWAASRLDVPEAERAAKAARLLTTVEGAALLTALGLGDTVRLGLR